MVVVVDVLGSVVLESVVDVSVDVSALTPVEAVDDEALELLDDVLGVLVFFLDEDVLFFLLEDVELVFVAAFLEELDVLGVAVVLLVEVVFSPLREVALLSVSTTPVVSSLLLSVESVDSVSVSVEDDDVSSPGAFVVPVDSDVLAV